MSGWMKDSNGVLKHRVPTTFGELRVFDKFFLSGTSTLVCFKESNTMAWIGAKDGDVGFQEASYREFLPSYTVCVEED